MSDFRAELGIATTPAPPVPTDDSIDPTDENFAAVAAIFNSTDFGSRFGQVPASGAEGSEPGEAQPSYVAGATDEATGTGQLPPPVTDATTSGAEGGLAGSLPPPSTEPPPPPPPGTFMVTTPDGQQIPLTNDQVLNLLYLDAWATSLPESVRDAYQAIESGQAVPLSVEEYNAYQQWRSQPPAPTTQPVAQPQPAPLPQVDPDAFYDPEVGKVLQRLTQEVATLRASATQPVPQSPTPAPTPPASLPPAASVPIQQPLNVAEYQRTIAETNRVLSEATTAFQTQYHLSDDETQALVQATVANGEIPQLMEAYRLRSPSGQVLREANRAEVMRVALERTAFLDPSFRDRLVDAQLQQRLAEESAATRTVADKKAKAAALATTPSATATIREQAGPLAVQDQMAAIAASLRGNGAFAEN